MRYRELFASFSGRVSGMTFLRSPAIRRLSSGLIMLLSGMAGCFAQTEPHARPEAKLARMTFALGETTFAILLPEVDEIKPAAGVLAVTIYDFTRGKRLQRQIRIGTGPRDPGASHDRMMALGGGRLDYQVTDFIGGGSAGPIGELTGRLEIGSLVLFIECTDQDDLGYTHPDWCLPYLNRLEIVRVP
jgi:hypothetical protein